MTITFDAQEMRNDPIPGGDSRHLDSDSCGENIDWSRGLAGLRDSQERYPNTSGTLLTKVIEGEIIPRLLLAHSQFAAKRLVSTGNPELPDFISSASFARLVLESEPAEIVDHVGSLLDRGVRLEQIFLDLLAPVARKLGELWEEDRCSFADVTLGLSRLHQVLHEIGRRNADGTVRRTVTRRAYFAATPGEQHTFGLSMLEEFFLHAGWETASDHAASAATVLQTASTQSLDIIGFSISCKERLDILADLIKRTRKASRNRDVFVMVGGSLFLNNPELAEKFDDATLVSDGVHAVQVAERLVCGSFGRVEEKKNG